MTLLTRYLEFMANYPVFRAFWVNITLTVFSGALALILGTIAVTMRISPIPSLRAVSTFYVNVLRDIPLTVVMVAMTTVVYFSLDVDFSGQLATDFYVGVVYFGQAPETSVGMMANFYLLAIIGLGLYHSSFIAEAIRSGVNTVPLGQAEAARAVGLTFLQSARIVILPQAFRGAIAPIGNTIIALIKNTTVASVTGVAVETSATMSGMIEMGPQFIILIFLTFALGYVIIVIPVGVLTTTLSRRLAVKR
ncbi:MAG: ABC transporter permease subunit [Propionibacteriaceae bacterium]|jgi:glutamate transport system permease protein|nr:ABC transporter permease subunit [Propionibacteriaceae bacterium]